MIQSLKKRKKKINEKPYLGFRNMFISNVFHSQISFLQNPANLAHTRLMWY